ncbi:MAG: RDD family protein [Cyanobacteriota bacterium]|nr:RDD family protein [Cyanobacteriota bacterium]
MRHQLGDQGSATSLFLPLLMPAMRYFNRVLLKTPESIELELTLAGIGSRALAVIIDDLVIGGLLVFVIWGTAFLFLGSLNLESLLGIEQTRLGQWLLALQGLLSFFIYVGYFVVFETLWQGQTPGKRYSQIRVIQDNGQMVGLPQAVLRALMRPIDELFMVGVLLITLGKREKRLGDWLAGTVVVQMEKPESTPLLTVSSASQELAEQWRFTTDWHRLKPDDYAVIREFLQRRRHMDSQAVRQLAQSLAQPVSRRLGLDIGLMDPQMVLEAVYWAYQEQKTERL